MRAPDSRQTTRLSIPIQPAKCFSPPKRWDARLLRLARRYPDMTPEEQTAVRHLIGMLVRDD